MALSQIRKHVGKENGTMRAHLEVLAPAQRKALKQVASLATRRGFYLGGGTALALYLGHRRSIDFDWFIQEPLGDPMLLAQYIRSQGMDFTTSKVEAGILHGLLSGVRFSFLEYPYPLLNPSVELKDFACSVASLDDLACMKLSALAQRGSKKDFVDIYALALKHRPLPDILGLYKRKYGVEDMSHVLYGLAYFDDADKERMPRMLWKTDWKTIKTAIRNWLGALP
jgi:nucleotidyltransferase AbiEii toxin of type IV toxin-antitoxin system